MVDSDASQHWIRVLFIEEADFVKRTSEVDLVSNRVGKDFVQFGYPVLYEYRDYSKWDYRFNIWWSVRQVCLLGYQVTKG